MTDDSVEDRLSTLERRVSFLENELDVSFEEDRFEKRIDRLFPDVADVETREGHFGYFARVTGINGDDVQRAIDKLEQRRYEYGHAVTETGEGLGMEVWTDQRA